MKNCGGMQEKEERMIPTVTEPKLHRSDRLRAGYLRPSTPISPPALVPLSFFFSLLIYLFYYMIARGVDVISMLVAIYGSPDVFVEQYQTLLSTRLLKQTQYYIDKEVIIYIQINTHINKITYIVSIFILLVTQSRAPSAPIRRG